jgi:hypothetical protein
LLVDVGATVVVAAVVVDVAPFAALAFAVEAVDLALLVADELAAVVGAAVALAVDPGISVATRPPTAPVPRTATRAREAVVRRI